MERRGSGMRKMIEAYQAHEHLVKCRAPEFRSTACEFHVVLWNMNYEENVEIKGRNVVKEFVKDIKQFVINSEEFVINNEKILTNEKELLKARKEFLKAQRTIYQLISANPKISAAKMAEDMGVSSRQVQKYLKRLTELKLITREGGRKFGTWKIIDEEYTGFFDRI